MCVACVFGVEYEKHARLFANLHKSPERESIKLMCMYTYGCAGMCIRLRVYGYISLRMLYTLKAVISLKP